MKLELSFGFAELIRIVGIGGGWLAITDEPALSTHDIATPENVSTSLKVLCVECRLCIYISN